MMGTEHGMVRRDETLRLRVTEERTLKVLGDG